MYDMNKNLKTVLTVLLSFVLLPLSAQERADTVYTFRFLPGRDMFYVPYGGNDAVLARLEDCVKRYKGTSSPGRFRSMWTAIAQPGRTRPETSLWRRPAPTA